MRSSCHPLRRAGFAFALAVLPLMAATATPTLALQPSVYSARAEHIAINGYDPVAYFVNAKPVKGVEALSADYNGAKWLFVSTTNRDAFVSAPETYAPQFGGYCAWAVSKGYTASTDPEAWKIVDGKLYLNYSKDVAVMWAKDIPGNIAKGHANWPMVLAE